MGSSPILPRKRMLAQMVEQRIKTILKRSLTAIHIKISFTSWQEGLGIIFLVLAISFLGYAQHMRGYKKGITDTISAIEQKIIQNSDNTEVKE